MRSSFLAALRGPDGRSLMRAMAVILFLSALIGGFHAGMAMAAGGGAEIRCSAAGPGGTGAPVVPSADHDCCLAACAAAHGIPATAAAMPFAASPYRPAWSATIARAVPSRPPLNHAAPRGPPLLA